MDVRLGARRLIVSKKDEPKKLAEAIEAAQRKQRRLGKKVEATQAKLEKRARKLRRLEAKLAELEQRAHAARSKQTGQTRGNGSHLLPARLIYNPKSGSSKAGDKLETIVEMLRSHGLRAIVDVKTSGRNAHDTAKAAAARGERLLIVAGGDSTVEEVAPALIHSKTALGILPVGTMNNVARSLGVPLELDDACALLGAGSMRQIDLGHVLHDGKRPADYFLETAGLGLSAIAFSAGKAAQKGPLAGLPRALLKFFDHKPDAVHIELDDGHTILANAQLVTASNAPLMGLNFLIAPDAKVDDGLLDVAVYDGMGKTELIEYFMAMKGGKRADNPQVRFYRSRHVRIRSATPFEVDADKNPLPDQRVLEIEVIPQALTMVVGKGIALSVPVETAPAAAQLSDTKEQGSNNQGFPDGERR